MKKEVDENENNDEEVKKEDKIDVVEGWREAHEEEAGDLNHYSDNNNDLKEESKQPDSGCFKILYK